MTYDEFRSYFNIVKTEQNCSATHTHKLGEEYKLEDIPINWDWREHNGVTSVKNQGLCGSCWTFSAIGAIESRYLIKYGQAKDLSEQQLVDCAGDYKNFGCEGGLPS